MSQTLRQMARERLDRVDPGISFDVMALATAMDPIIPRIAEARAILAGLHAAGYQIAASSEGNADSLRATLLQDLAAKIGKHNHMAKGLWRDGYEECRAAVLDLLRGTE